MWKLGVHVFVSSTQCLTTCPQVFREASLGSKASGQTGVLSPGGPKACDTCIPVSESSRLPAYLVAVLLEIVLPRWHAQGGLVYLETHRGCDSWQCGGIPAACLRWAEVFTPKTVPGRTQAPCGRQMLPNPSLSLIHREVGCKVGTCKEVREGLDGA